MMVTWTDERTPALAIVARGDQIETLSPSEFRVLSQSRPGVSYRVTVERGRWACECPFAQETKQVCIHQLSVRFRAGFQAPKDPETSPPCAKCGSGDVERAGVRQNKSGPVRRFRCRVCGHNYSGKEGFHNRRSDPEVIAKALDLYFRGTSLRQIADHFAQAYGLKVSDTTVYRWIFHYSKLAAEWMAAQNAKVGKTWHVDERVVNVNGENHYLWNIMDSDTRFLLASRISKGRGIPEARAAFRAANAATEVEPVELRSDGYSAYPEAIKSEFGRPRLPTDGPRNPKSRFGRSVWTPHRLVPSIRAPESNNRIERMHGSQKDRTKTMRAYDNDGGAAALSLGWQVHYNLVRPHLALGGATPGEAAGLPDLGGFRWRTILDLATRRNEAALGGNLEPAE
jgi:transposase-like protein